MVTSDAVRSKAVVLLLLLIHCCFHRLWLFVWSVFCFAFLDLQSYRWGRELAPRL